MEDPKSTYLVRFVNWNSHEAEAVKRIRFTVFVDEQKVPPELELDETDGIAVHVLAENRAGDVCGTGRMFPDVEQPSQAKIGRMAVMKAFRGRGCGAAILDALVQEARRRGFKTVALSAQVHAVAFYEHYGFKAEGKVYDDAGIPHKTMTMLL